MAYYLTLAPFGPIMGPDTEVPERVVRGDPPAAMGGILGLLGGTIMGTLLGPDRVLNRVAEGWPKELIRVTLHLYPVFCGSINPYYGLEWALIRSIIGANGEAVGRCYLESTDTLLTTVAYIYRIPSVRPLLHKRSWNGPGMGSVLGNP